MDDLHQEWAEKIKEKMSQLGYAKDQVDVFVSVNHIDSLMVGPPYDFVVVLRPL